MDMSLAKPENDPKRVAAGLFPAEADLYALPGVRRPRLVLSGGSAGLRWRESAWLPAYRWQARLYRLAMRLWYVANPGSFALPKRLGPSASPVGNAHVAPGFFVPQSPPTPNAEISRLRLAVRVGTADSRQKLTLLLLDERAQLVRVAKLGVLPLAQQLVAREGMILDALPDGVGPRLLRAGDARALASMGVNLEASGGRPPTDARAVVFEPVQGRAVAARLPPSPYGRDWGEIDGLLAKFASPHRHSAAPVPLRPPARTLPYLRALPLRPAFPSRLHPALCRLAEAHPLAAEWIASLADREWPVVLEHGDFAPWNLLRTSRGLRAIDWEDSRPDGFPGFDLAHYVIQTGVLMHRWGAERVGRYARLRLQAAGFSDSAADAVVRLASLQDSTGARPGEQAELQAVRGALMDQPVPASRC